VAEILGISLSRLRSLARSVLVDPKRGSRNEYRFSFADVILLRTTRDLMESGIPLRRVKQVLTSLRTQLPEDQPLSALHITSDGDSVVVKEEKTVWDPQTEQVHLDFSVHELAEKIAPIAGAMMEGTTISEMTADDWYDLALDLEGVATDRATQAYGRAIALHPGHVHAHLNLGRLLHESGEIESAEAHYRQALSANPESALAAFNLGVALEDLDRVGEAIEAYERALRFEPDTASAHYNLSRLYEEKGLTKDALRHLADYKRLV
jgi:tetratricopeptide (TPR) repeat protein